MAVTASAAGKLFLLGEYAVLHDAPALVAAVDARARVVAEAATAWCVSAPQLGIHDFALAADGSLPADGPADTARALEVFDAVRATSASLIELPPIRVTIDSGAFFAGGAKLGLGASAAVAAALTGAFAGWASQRPSQTQLCGRAIAAHRLAQGAGGSGADVAAAVYGGLVEYRKGRQPRRRPWPAGLHALAVVTGTGADTRELVAAVRSLERAEHARYHRCMERLSGLAASGQAALERDDPAALLAAADDYFDGLAALGAAAHAPIVTGVHHQLRRLAAEHACVFKTTGAGGGDLGIVLTASPSALARCAQALAAAGHRPLRLRFGAGGLRIRRLPGQHANARRAPDPPTC